MVRLGIIASQDVETSGWLANVREIELPTGDTSVPARLGSLHGCELIVLRRNSSGRPVPPHALAYRANVEALARAGVRRVLTTAMVGSLRHSIPTGSMLILDQFIDFTRNRQSTYFTGSEFGHADMAEPYCPTLRGQMIRCAEAIGLTVAPGGCYVCVPGPRFETRAEVRMFAQLGGDVVGFTNVTDCVMAREARIVLRHLRRRRQSRCGTVRPGHEIGILARRPEDPRGPVHRARHGNDPNVRTDRRRHAHTMSLRHGRPDRDMTLASERVPEAPLSRSSIPAARTSAVTSHKASAGPS